MGNKLKLIIQEEDGTEIFNREISIAFETHYDFLIDTIGPTSELMNVVLAYRLAQKAGVSFKEKHDELKYGMKHLFD